MEGNKLQIVMSEMIKWFWESNCVERGRVRERDRESGDRERERRQREKTERERGDRERERVGNKP